MSGNCGADREAPEEEDGSEEQEASHMAMFVADMLRADISNLLCLQCGQEEADVAAAAPCYATIHPFCDAFHRWLCKRLLSDGRTFSCVPEDLLRSAGARHRAAQAATRATAGAEYPPRVLVGGARATRATRAGWASQRHPGASTTALTAPAVSRLDG
jgi:hypothetical protein